MNTAEKIFKDKSQRNHYIQNNRCQFLLSLENPREAWEELKKDNQYPLLFMIKYGAFEDIETLYNKTGIKKPLEEELQQYISPLSKDILSQLNEKNEFGHTPAYYAAMKGHAGILKLFLRCFKEETIISEIQNDDHCFLNIIKLGHLEVVKLLIAYGIYIYLDYKDKKFKDALPKQKKYKEIAELLNIYYPGTQFEINYSLCLAAAHNHQDIMDILFQKGALANGDEDNDEFLPLGFAAVHGQHETVKILLKKGADINRLTKYLKDQEAFIRDKRTLTIIKNHKQLPQNLKKAIEKGSLESVKAFMEASGNFKHVKFILLEAAKNGCLRIFKYFYDLEIKNRAKETLNEIKLLMFKCLALAADNKHKESIDFIYTNLFSYEKKKDPNGNNFLHCAILDGYEMLVSVISHRSPDSINELNKKKQTPLYLAAECGNEEAVQILIAHRADIISYKNPRIAAVMKGHQSISEILHRYKFTNSDFDLFNKAVVFGDLRIIKEILSRLSEKLPEDLRAKILLHITLKKTSLPMLKNLPEHKGEHHTDIKSAIALDTVNMKKNKSALILNELEKYRIKECCCIIQKEALQLVKEAKERNVFNSVWFWNFSENKAIKSLKDLLEKEKYSQKNFNQTLLRDFIDDLRQLNVSLLETATANHKITLVNALLAYENTIDTNIQEEKLLDLAAEFKDIDLLWFLTKKAIGIDSKNEILVNMMSRLLQKKFHKLVQKSTANSFYTYEPAYKPVLQKLLKKEKYQKDFDKKRLCEFCKELCGKLTDIPLTGEDALYKIFTSAKK